MDGLPLYRSGPRKTKPPPPPEAQDVSAPAQECRTAHYTSKGFPISQWDYEATDECCWARPKSFEPGLEFWSIYNSRNWKGVPNTANYHGQPTNQPTNQPNQSFKHITLWNYHQVYNFSIFPTTYSQTLFPTAPTSCLLPTQGFAFTLFRFGIRNSQPRLPL
ncbi:hypothetical protein VTI74DRAFT_5670 [Chaetomium olivicolor]